MLCVQMSKEDLIFVAHPSEGNRASDEKDETASRSRKNNMTRPTRRCI